MTSLTPVSPRWRRQCRNPVQTPCPRCRRLEPEYLVSPVRADTGSDDHGLRDYAVIDPGLAVGRVREHVRERDVAQRPAAKRGDLLIEVLAGPRNLGLGDAGDGSHRTRSSTALMESPSIKTANRARSTVDPAAPLEQCEEVRAGPQLRDAQVQVSGRGRQRLRLRAVPVALGGAGLGALTWLARMSVVASASVSSRSRRSASRRTRSPSSEERSASSSRAGQDGPEPLCLAAYRREPWRVPLTLTRWLAPCQGLQRTGTKPTPLSRCHLDLRPHGWRPAAVDGQCASPDVDRCLLLRGRVDEAEGRLRSTSGRLMAAVRDRNTSPPRHH